MERSERNRDGRRGGTNEESKEESKDEQDRGIRPDEEKERRESEGEGGDGDGDGDGDEEDGWDLVYEAEHGAAAARSIHAFVSVPFRLERFLALGVMSCVQLVCLVAGIVPFRFLVGVMYVVGLDWVFLFFFWLVCFCFCFPFLCPILRMRMRMRMRMRILCNRVETKNRILCMNSDPFLFFVGKEERNECERCLEVIG